MNNNHCIYNFRWYFLKCSITGSFFFVPTDQNIVMYAENFLKYCDIIFLPYCPPLLGESEKMIRLVKSCRLRKLSCLFVWAVSSKRLGSWYSVKPSKKRRGCYCSKRGQKLPINILDFRRNAVYKLLDIYSSVSGVWSLLPEFCTGGSRLRSNQQ